MSPKTRGKITKEGKQSVFLKEKQLIQLLFNYQYPQGSQTTTENYYDEIMKIINPTQKNTKFDSYKRYNFGELTWTYTLLKLISEKNTSIPIQQVRIIVQVHLQYIRQF